MRFPSIAPFASLALFTALAGGCPGTPAEGEGEGDVGEGEGEGEGEGDVGEGEGEGDVGEGEGEGDVGEGEGDVGEGEGEGEGDVASVFVDGDLAVGVTTIDTLDVPVRVFAPTSGGPYPAVQFQHGFLMSTEWYTTMLTQIASHGFVVVAPQMYTPDNNPLFKPSIAEEASAAALVTAELDNLNLNITPERTVVGHSRGGKVIWSMLDTDPTLFDRVLLLDPVDGTQAGGRVVDDVVGYNVPTVIVGTGLGEQDDGGFFSQPCAPDGDSHDEFFADAPAGAVHLIADDAGHNDLLDDTTPGCAVCGVCLAGSDPAAVRATFGGLVVAFINDVVADVRDHAPIALR